MEQVFGRGRGALTGRQNPNSKFQLFIRQDSLALFNASQRQPPTGANFGHRPDPRPDPRQEVPVATTLINKVNLVSTDPHNTYTCVYLCVCTMCACLCVCVVCTMQMAKLCHRVQCEINSKLIIAEQTRCGKYLRAIDKIALWPLK